METGDREEAGTLPRPELLVAGTRAVTAEWEEVGWFERRVWRRGREGGRKLCLKQGTLTELRGQARQQG